MMTSPSEELIRLAVSGILHSAPWTHTFLCYLCLLNLVLDHLGPGYDEYVVRRTMDRIFERPRPLTYLQSFRCAKCQYTMQCLGSG